ncbi:hypothetical protein ADK36_13825 [Streptomyces viridochromogenes]|nr:hypothetical protein ADK36_13825 [Streptomyces viridochromogenes]
MAQRMMNGPEPLYRLVVVKRRTQRNPAYTGWGCGEPLLVATDETYTEIYGPYVRQHAATTMKGKESGPFTVSAEIQVCAPQWGPVVNAAQAKEA